MSRPPLRVAVLGAGTIGGAVLDGLLRHADRLPTADGAPLTVVAVAVRDMAKARPEGLIVDLLTDAPAHVVADPDIDVIVELMGGIEPARTLITAALGAGKSVVTANKSVIAHHGPALEAEARKSGAAFRFEAAVAGGIPILAPLAAELHCAKEFAGVTQILDQGASYARQTRVADAADGDLREVVHHLIREFRGGPTLREVVSVG